MINIDELESLAKAATPGPWASCNNTSCKCTSIHCDDHPIADITKGDWGDDYPSIRLEGTSLDTKAVAYMSQITYGHVPEDQAMANKAFIVGTNPSVILELIEEIKTLRNEVSKNEDIMNSALVINYKTYRDAVLREMQKLDSTINGIDGDLTMDFAMNKSPANVAKELVK